MPADEESRERLAVPHALIRGPETAGAATAPRAVWPGGEWESVPHPSLSEPVKDRP
ncbi:hypothetical protein [Streptomyces sp. NBC_01803]|uniref:hypothetical protein n=1 Tax=Streptomyces sp. NBC_01803 TaxID=2975946 RepID=UPI002DD99087|nr:hypothetical protein [Streptomyces sp. NBC_01803]WSA46295.1 hypothetical protein OIE51_20155 [Streptomyces sp. NBC_01803]